MKYEVHQQVYNGPPSDIGLKKKIELPLPDSITTVKCACLFESLPEIMGPPSHVHYWDVE